jgi:AraC-like DNA-binding protein
MVSIGTLLDGLHVTLAGSISSASGRATLHCFSERLVVTTPRLPTGHAAGPGASVAVPFDAVCLGTIGLFDGLRRPLVTRLDAHGPLGRCAEALREEAAGEALGARAMVEALLRRCLILMLRCCVERGLPVAWLPSLNDPGLVHAVVAMREDPARAFTLASLAQLAGMSRSVFAERFAAELEVPPMEFLTTLRLERAASLLARSELRVKAVAARVGYRSRSSFTRAFTLSYGVGPTEFRAAATDPASSVSLAPSRARASCRTMRSVTTAESVAWTASPLRAVSS